MRTRPAPKLEALALLSAALWAGIAACGPAPATLSSRPPAAPPHVVILLADDLGWNDVGYHGSEIRTPHLDRLAASGVRLERYYSFPICTPTRSALLTGRSPMRLGTVYATVKPWSLQGLPLDEHLLPETFRAAGYQTALIGKWHLGHAAPEQWPMARGFDHFYGLVNGALDYWSHEWQGAVDWSRNGVTVREEGYATHLLAAEAVRWIEGRDRNRPMFLYLPFNAPHTPLHAPKERIAEYEDIEDPRRRRMAAMVAELDAAVGAVRAALEREGIADDTLLLFASDNGGFVRFGGSNAPLRAGKTTTFEGGIRVPAILHWPAGLAGGRSSDQVVTVQDLFPTLAAAAGVEPAGSRPFDGRDLWQELVAGDPTPREDLFFASGARVEGRFAVLRGDWKLVELRPPEGEVRALLFRLDEDPAEEHDLSAAHPELTRELQERLEEWRQLHPPGGLRPQPDPPEGWEPPAEWTATSGASAAPGAG